MRGIGRIIATSTWLILGCPAYAQSGYEALGCQELWRERNAFYARNGYCFTVPEAVAVFGGGCFPPYGRLSDLEQQEVNTIVSWEKEKGCVGVANRSPHVALDVPIIVGKNRAALDGCGAVGQVEGVDPRGDGFLSVRSGPGGSPYREIARLFNGQQVYICSRRGAWYGVVYNSPEIATVDCGVATSRDAPQPYTGPCPYGWVHSRYVRPITVDSR